MLPIIELLATVLLFKFYFSKPWRLKIPTFAEYLV